MSHKRVCKTVYGASTASLELFIDFGGVELSIGVLLRGCGMDERTQNNSLNVAYTGMTAKNKLGITKNAGGLL